MSWRALAGELGIPPSTFTRMANGHAPSAHTFAAMCRWLGSTTENFIVSELPDDAQEQDLLSELAPLLRARKDLTKQDVEYLEELIGAAVKRFNSERSGV
jgi:transcriptional regulator with XRE-family HTH domain